MEDCTPETRSYTLAEALPLEQARVRELLPAYRAIPSGAFAVMLMEQALHVAEQASERQDTVAMLRALRNLQSFAE